MNGAQRACLNSLVMPTVHTVAMSTLCRGGSGMRIPYSHHPDDYHIWEHYDALKIPVLSLRGAESDLILPQTVEGMRQRGRGAAGLRDGLH